MARLGGYMSAMSAIVKAANDGEAYDQMLGEGNTMGNGRVQPAINALILQIKSIEKVVAASGLKTATFKGSHSLDNPNAVFK